MHHTRGLSKEIQIILLSSFSSEEINGVIPAKVNWENDMFNTCNYKQGARTAKGEGCRSLKRKIHVITSGGPHCKMGKLQISEERTRLS